MKRFASAVPLDGALAASILGAVDDYILVIDPMGRLIFVSSAAGEVLGREPEHWLGMSALDLVHPDDLELITSRMHPGRTNPLSPRQPVQVRVGDGRRWLPVVADGFIQIDVNGSPGQLITLRDVRRDLDADRGQRLAAQTLSAQGPDLAGNRELIFDLLLPAMMSDDGPEARLLIVYIAVDQGPNRTARRHAAAPHEYDIRDVAGALAGFLRERDVITKLGAAELIVACPNIKTARTAAGITKRLFDAAEAAVPEGCGVRASCAAVSIGDDLAEVLAYLATADELSTSAARA